MRKVVPFYFCVTYSASNSLVAEGWAKKESSSLVKLIKQSRWEGRKAATETESGSQEVFLFQKVPSRKREKSS